MLHALAFTSTWRFLTPLLENFLYSLSYEARIDIKLLTSMSSELLCHLASRFSRSAV